MIWKRKPVPFICTQCGEIAPEDRETHRSVYVQGDWEGFPCHVREGRDPAATYLVNPAHPDSSSALIRFPPERAGEMAARRGSVWRDRVVVAGWPMALVGLILVISMLERCAK